MSFGFTYNFPALRGTQAGREYYVIMCPLSLLPKLFVFDEASLPPELRAQRTLNTARLPEIKNYIIGNPETYAFSAITASVDGNVHFECVSAEPGGKNIGLLEVSMSARFIVNDGQHRRAAIEAALEERPELGGESIAVVFFLDEGLKRSQQLFADLNQHAVKPTRSISILYDARDPLAGLARYLAETAAPFRGLTEMEKTTISNRSIPLFTLSAIYQATEALLGKRRGEVVSDDETDLSLSFWNELVKVFPEWRLATERHVRSAELRRDYVHAHGVVLLALGIAGHALTQAYPESWKEMLALFEKLDWRRMNAELWEGRALSGGQMSKTRQSVSLTANLLKSTLRLPLTADEQELEKRFRASTRPIESVA